MSYEEYISFIQSNKGKVIQDFLEDYDKENLTFYDVNEYIENASVVIESNLVTTEENRYSDVTNIQNEIEGILYDNLDINMED